MALEIERKFLVDPSFSFAAQAEEVHEIWQGYLASSSGMTTRVRRMFTISMHPFQPTVQERSFLTVKGPTKGSARAEFEYEIPGEDASDMLRMCSAVLFKHRWVVVDENQQRWEIDVFKGEEFNGLVVAEIELPSENTEVVLPQWVTEEVTHDPYYYNSNLIKLVTKSNEISLP